MNALVKGVFDMNQIDKANKRNIYNDYMSNQDSIQKKKHSIFSIISLIIALIVCLGWIVIGSIHYSAFQDFFKLSVETGYSPTELWEMDFGELASEEHNELHKNATMRFITIGILNMFLLMATIVGVALAIVGLVLKNRKRYIAVLGLIANIIIPIIGFVSSLVIAFSSINIK